VSLAPIGGTTYAGVYNAAADTTPLDESYSVDLVATDEADNSAGAACGTFTVPSPDPEPPVIVSCDAAPRSLPPAGGDVVITAEVTDNVGVAEVIATVSSPGQADTTVPLSLQVGDEFSGVFAAPPNPGSAPVVHSIRVAATDALGNSAEADCGTVEVQASAFNDTEPPVIVSLDVTPRLLPQAGGQVLIAAEVTDNVAVKEVFAAIARPDLTHEFVALSLDTGDTYVGSFTVPANAGESAQDYLVSVAGSDTSGNLASADGGAVNVAGTPVLAGRLEVSPARLSFGRTHVGLERRARVTLRNTGKGVLTGSLATLAAPFSRTLQGNPRGDVSFTLAPGQSRTVSVRFSPASAHRFQDNLGVLSNDPDRPTAEVALTGVGCRRRRR
jgi:hypothetical protein